MEPPKLFLLHVLLFFLFSATVSSSFSPPTTTSNTTAKSTTPSPSSSTLDPKQLRALQYLNVSTTKNPCFQPSSTTCDDSTPFRHLLSLHLSSCSDHTHISTTVLKSLDSLTSFSLLNCHISSSHFPTKFATNLRSFTCINSFRKLTGVFLSRLTNLTDLTVSGVTITASGLSIFLAPMKSLHSLTITDTHLTGYLPKSWHLNLTHIDLSRNSLGGKIPTSLTSLENLQHLNLSSNNINGEIPDSVGELLVLKNLSLASNSLSGAIPDSISAMEELLHLDLSTNQLNGSVPKSIAEMKNLKYLSLENNKFHGVMPFNESFIKSLIVFKIGGNSDLCYNQSTISSKLKLEISACDKNGFPISPPPAKDSLKDGSSSRRVSDSEDDDEVKSERKTDDHKGPNKVVLGVAIGLSSIVFVIVFLVLLSKWCG